MKRILLILLLLFFSFPLWTQQQAGAPTNEHLSFVGMTLTGLLERFGPPRTVVSARGNEYWQDDVVFQYDDGDFYIYRDRVWQVKFASSHGISFGDRKQTVLMVLGNTAEDRGDHVLFPVPGNDWPLMLRINLNSSGLVSAIYLYRPDF
jgi:hypothetical protein